MQEQTYIYTINQYIERLLVFETVFKEYAHTCQNIDKGNCYASESLSRLKEYFSKNLIRFNTFVQTVSQLSAPNKYAVFNQHFIEALKEMQSGAIGTLRAIDDENVDHSRFEASVEKQAQARQRISSIFEYIGQPIY
ncbi:hypothetical protein [Lacticaseibacillus brantae]|uniref:LXG domain-containing protein n=1 Tax=Lacticaseibacillus brantae DSM 23927 TaxID=1423727 RepID=A0A0R2B0Y6_9LACO|nr:hypothetical protein [Lacticaseibacillus brantae]KRM72730.1 hypothetical protein FC34_GL000440 [Lacticaseibacillus brantae DSM 23927]